MIEKEKKKKGRCGHVKTARLLGLPGHKPSSKFVQREHLVRREYNEDK